MVALLAGAANTPIAASIMAIELFGPTIAPYAAVACVVSFLMTGHKSVYPSQILSMKKSAYLHVETGKEICEIHPDQDLRDKSTTRFVRERINNLTHKFERKRPKIKRSVKMRTKKKKV